MLKDNNQNNWEKRMTSNNIISISLLVIRDLSSNVRIKLFLIRNVLISRWEFLTLI